MRDAGALREICAEFRQGERVPDDAVVAEIEADVRAYRARFFTRPAPPLPPGELLELLPLMGWLIYEVSLGAVRGVKASFESMDEADAAASRQAYGWVRRLADAARHLVWPEFAPRALGAIRAQALAESKRDTEDGYGAAYIVHREAAERYESYRETHGDHPGRERYLLALDEIFLQLALAEAGTACRTAERVLCRWVEDFAGDSTDEERWVQRLYRDLADGIEVGSRALSTADRIRAAHGLVDTVTEHRLALVTAFRNPGVMTARAALLALTLAPAMEHLGRAPSRRPTWAGERADLLDRFRVAYRAIEEPVRSGGTTRPMVLDHRRALVQLRLNLALLVPGAALPCSGPFDSCPGRDPLDDDAVTELSRWLATERSNGGAKHGNSIGAFTMPLAVRSVLALRGAHGDAAGYLRWRRKWPQLGRFSTEPARARQIEAVLTAAAAAPLLNVGAE